MLQFGIWNLEFIVKNLVKGVPQKGNTFFFMLNFSRVYANFVFFKNENIPEQLQQLENNRFTNT